MASSKWQGSVETNVKAPLEGVWKITREHYEAHKWYPGMKSCERVEGAPLQGVGSVRRCIMCLQPDEEGGDSFVVEELIALDDTQHSWTIRLIDTDLPGFLGCEGTMHVCEAKQEGNCLVKWSFEIDPIAGKSKEDIEAIWGSIIIGMAKNLEQLTASQ